MRTIMAGLAEFEGDLIRERVKSGLAAARSRGVLLGRQVGQRPSEKESKKVLQLHEEGLSYRLIGRNVGLSKNMRTPRLTKQLTKMKRRSPRKRPQLKK
jgi:putative DNA-invertase from lambdoid prophage Rac